MSAVLITDRRRDYFIDLVSPDLRGYIAGLFDAKAFEATTEDVLTTR